MRHLIMDRSLCVWRCVGIGSVDGYDGTVARGGSRATSYLVGIGTPVM
jgi:hypothetical protein